MSRNVTLVVNPTAGKGRAQELLPQVAGKFRDADLPLQILLSRDFAEAQQMTRDAVADGVDVLAVMGGDGMIHLGVNTCAQQDLLGDHSTTLGLIPAGTGNDLCHGLGLDPKDPVQAAAGPLPPAGACRST
jgi:diacylglycerol kinase (ATP)